MTDKKISELTAITGAVLSDTDLIPVVDVSVSETKKITFAEFKNALDTSTGFVRLTGDTMTGTLVVPSLTANGDITVTGNVDGRDVSIDGIKLDGIEAGADVTDTANVTAAGALMDSELANLTAVKAINQGLSTTDSPSFAGISATTATISGGTINGTSVGSTAASTGAFTTLSASSTVSGTGFSTYLASPPAIGSTAPSTGAFTTLSASSTVSGTGFSTYLASPPAIGSTAPSAMYANSIFTGKLSSSLNTKGAQLNNDGTIYSTSDAASCIYINRLTDDGNLMSFRRDGAQQGSISVAGTTVSYNGGHLARWAQFSDNSRPALLKGTVLSNLDQMSHWENEDNEQLNCIQVSNIEGDANVAGVFVTWDNQDDGYNDILLGMTGDMVIRIAAGTTVQRGDLLMSAGDGTAMPQEDDIIRAKTVAKVTSTHVSHLYEDGSYCVPCVLMAC
jgi:hypothetical protein